MPYLRMFLGEKAIDDVYISESFLQSVISNHILEEEKQRMLDKHAPLIRTAFSTPYFVMESVPSTIGGNYPLGTLKKSE